MTTDSLAAMQWWQWALVALVCVTAIVIVRRWLAQTRHRAATEKLARNADATHESERTRHQGGP